VFRAGGCHLASCLLSGNKLPAEAAACNSGQRNEQGNQTEKESKNHWGGKAVAGIRCLGGLAARKKEIKA